MSFRLTYHDAEFALNLFAPFWILTVEGESTACMPSHSLGCSSARLVDIGNALLNYRLSIQQTVATRMKILYSWNLNNWHASKQPKRDVRMRKYKRLGPICLQETKSSASEKEVLLQHIPGLQIAESLTTSTRCTFAAWLCIKRLPQPGPRQSGYCSHC